MFRPLRADWRLPAQADGPVGRGPVGSLVVGVAGAMQRRSIWKVIGLAGLAGVAATGVAVTRSERQRRSYTPEAVRSRLQDRLENVGRPPEAATEPGTRQPEKQPSGARSAGTRGVAPKKLSVGRTAPEALELARAAELTRTGDLWLFRGPSAADHAIRTLTNSPVNHVGMAIVLEDLPPLMWHAELGLSVLDVWSGTHHRGVQLHDLCEAVTTWSVRYRQECWLRQLEAEVAKNMEDALLREIARKDGLPFPSILALAGQWVRGRLRRGTPAEAAYCAAVVASSYQAMGLLSDKYPANWFDPGRFWSGDRLELLSGAKLGDEIRVLIGDTRVLPRSK